ncbi:MAG: hypothetical protein ACKV19_11465 [Verrucomicrobiales bacterium]
MLRMFKQVHPRWAVVITSAALILSSGAAIAQAPQPAPPAAAVPHPVPPKPIPLQPGGARPALAGQGGLGFQPGPGAGVAVLSRNYSVKLTLKNGDTAETVEVLTASPRISFTAMLGKPPAMMLNLTGNLQEVEGGGLVMDYSVGGRVPEIVESAVTITGGSPSVARNFQYSDETSAGAIHVTPGADHTVFASGARAYILTITPVERAH